MNRTRFTIGNLAKAAGVGVETIRYYQRRGLVDEPQRPYGSVRRYGETHIQRLRFIRAAQDLGFSLAEVAELLKLSDGMECREAQKLAEEKLNQVRLRRARLERIETLLGGLVERCRVETGSMSCPLIEALSVGKLTRNDTSAII